MCILENNFYLGIVRIFLASLFLLAGLTCIAQNKTDSLELKLKEADHDSAKIRILIQLSAINKYVDLNKSKAYAKRAIAIAEEKDLVAEKAQAYQTLGNLYSLSGDYSNALRYDNLALRMSFILNDSLEISRNYSGIANDYFDLGEYDEAYYYFTQSHRIGAKIGNKLRIAIATHNIGRLYKVLEQYDAAMKNLLASMKISREIGDDEGIPYSYHEIADVLLRKGEYDSALQTFMNSLKMTRQQGIKELEPRTLAKIASVYLRKKDFREALAYFDSTFNLHARTNNQFGIAEVELGRGTLLTDQGKYDEAVRTIQNSLSKARKLNARNLQISCYSVLSQIHELKGDFKQSLGYFKQFKSLEDSIFGNDMQEKLLRDQIRFETEAKDTQIAALRSAQEIKDDQLKKQEFIRNILVVVMALSVILLATVYRSGQRRRQINALLLNHQVEMEKRSDELERLNQVKDKFFSIISHDLRSPINALSGLLDLLDKGAVQPHELPGHLNELKTRFNHTRTLLNNLLDWTLLQMDKLNLQPARVDLKKLVNENIDLVGPVQTKQITILNQIPQNAIAFADANTTNLVIRNLLTNAIKFTNDGGEVVINALEKNNFWTISVKDNGVGMNEEVLKILFDKTAPYTTRGTANEKGTGLGLILCKEFIEKNGGRIWVESKQGKGSTFSFTLPKPV